MVEAAPEKKPDIKIVQGRSPAYPYISLKEAIALAQQAHSAGATRAILPAETFYQIWKMGPQSSGSRQSLAALNHFGLVDYIGRGEDRKIKLSDLALKILLDRSPDSVDRQAAIREAALTPPIHAELYARFSSFLPADVVLETYLTLDRGYNSQGAKALIEEYKSTLEFSGLDKPSETAPTGSVLKPAVPVNVGDFVQVEIGGAFQLREPARVRAIREHEGQEWIFIEGSESGVPIDQVIVQTKTSPAVGSSTSPPPRYPEEKVSETSGKGEREWLRGPLARDVSYRLFVSGELGPKEIGKLIKLLKAQQAVLSDEDDLDAD